MNFRDLFVLKTGRKRYITLFILLISVLFSCSDKYVSYEKNFCEIGYSKKHHQAKYVFYKLYKQNQDNKVNRTNLFYIDHEIDSVIEITSYKGTGYDRGHLKPAGVSKSSKEEMKESFLMSNISPQKAYFNRVVWKKYEVYERKLLKEFDSLKVYTGTILPKYFPKKLNGSNITIPKGFFKSILLPDSSSVNFIVYQNRGKDKEYKSQFLSINALENHINIDMYSGLPDDFESEIIDSTRLAEMLN